MPAIVSEANSSANRDTVVSAASRRGRKHRIEDVQLLPVRVCRGGDRRSELQYDVIGSSIERPLRQALSVGVLGKGMGLLSAFPDQVCSTRRACFGDLTAQHERALEVLE